MLLDCAFLGDYNFAATIGLAVTDRAVRDMIGEERIGLADQAWLFADVEELEDLGDFLLAGADSPRNVDLLLGTRGWRRFAWFEAEEVLAAHGDKAKRVLTREGRPQIPEVAEDIGPGLARQAIAGVVDGEAVDLEFQLADDAELKILTVKDEEGLHIFRHSSAHLLAAAVKELFPDAKYGIGPPIQDGFYYDFDLGQDDEGRVRTFTPEDLERIEARMKEIVEGRSPIFTRRISHRRDLLPNTR